MICFLTSDNEFNRLIRVRLAAASAAFKFIQATNKHGINAIYDDDVTAVIVDAENDNYHRQAWLDLLNSLGCRIPVIVISKEEGFCLNDKYVCADRVSWMSHPTSDEVANSLVACGAIGGDIVRDRKKTIPVLNNQTPINMLKSAKSLSMLTIDASKFRGVATEYGTDVYLQLQACFQSLLSEAWGSPGYFRTRDNLCRKSPDSNIYYVFLEPARDSSQIPKPGALEKLCDRLVGRIQNRLWEELVCKKVDRMLPICLKSLPNFSVGHATMLYNPCIEITGVRDRIFDKSLQMAKVQMVRVESNQRQMLRTLIQTDGALIPHFQGVFVADSLTRDQVGACDGGRNIGPIEENIFGFESLIRVQHDRLEVVFGNDNDQVYVDPKFLRPDVLFSLASSCRLLLELDQACLKKAAEEFAGFPYHLLVNILPRNLYHIDILTKMFPREMKLTFELSETEDINNLELLLKIRKRLEQMGYGIAADDFGKGYASLNRVLRVEPDIIKLDRSLIEDIDKDDSKRAFVKGLIEATRVSKSTILGEGVERWEELEVLKEMGVTLVQGFLLHRPQALSEIDNTLAGPNLLEDIRLKNKTKDAEKDKSGDIDSAA